MFWGLMLEPGKRYSTTVEKSFHVSMAALDCSSVRNENEILSVVLETEGSEALLCNLCKQMGILQHNLDLNFMTGDRLTFECRGHGRVHLTGYLLPDDEDDVSGMLGDEESEDEEEAGWVQTSNKENSKKEKRKLDGPPEVSSKKKKPNDEEEEDSDSEGSDFDMSDVGMDDEDLDDEEVDDEESDEDEDSDDEEEDEQDVNLSKKSNQKQQPKPDKNKTPNKKNLDSSSNKKTPVTNGLTPKEQKLNKKTPAGNKTPNNQTPPQQRKVLDLGVVVKDVRVGTGTPAKPGRMVSVHYLGRLRDGGQVFDKKLKGQPFQFRLGKGEVIKGWDIGVQGMKCGGKRIIHCPPEAAYGAKGAGPKIPANSALTFEVELKGVN